MFKEAAPDAGVGHSDVETFVGPTIGHPESIYPGLVPCQLEQLLAVEREVLVLQLVLETERCVRGPSIIRGPSALEADYSSRLGPGSRRLPDC